MVPNRLVPPLALSLLVSFAGCDGGGLPEGWARTPEAGGPRIAWDLDARPIANLPLPNDIATWPDPSSPTGLRLNPSLIVDTRMERVSREGAGRLDGWGTFAPIMIPFEAPIDIADFYRRQGGSDAFSTARFATHAVYLVDLETGEPMPLDVNTGNNPVVLPGLGRMYDNDPRANESNLVFETVEEDLDADGILDPGEDTDFDGVLDHPNTFSGVEGSERNWDVDEITTFWERETNTLYLRPLLPMKPEHRYAVVVTDRVVDGRGRSARSPFESVHPLAQRDALAPLPRLLAARPELYGDLAARGWGGVAFAWSFTTQSTTRDLDTIREGLYGRGRLAWLASRFPPTAAVTRMQGGVGGISCDVSGNNFVATGDQFRQTLETLLSAPGVFELSEDRVAKVLASYQALDHVAVMFFDSPYFLDADPDHPSLESSWQVDSYGGHARVVNDVATAIVMIPKETATRRQPFPSFFYVHGHGSANAEALPFAGYILQQGAAAVFLNANGHGVDIDPSLIGVVRGIFGAACMAPAAEAVLAGRARDVDGDPGVDSGANFWSAWGLRTRDEVRQTVVDHVRAVQILRSFDGRPWAPKTVTHRALREPVAFSGDVDGDGVGETFGDFDGNGVPDLGGPTNHYGFGGGSLGGIMTGVMAGVEPALDVAIPIVGGGGLMDVGVRTSNGSVRKTMHLRLMSPFVWTMPSSGPGEDSSCAAGEISLRVRATYFDDDPHYEFACVPGDLLDADDALVVRNFTNGVVRCAGATGGEAGRYRVPVPSSEGDAWVVEIYRDAAPLADWGTCTFDGRPRPARVVDRIEVASTACRRCATFGWRDGRPRTFEVGEQLVSPATGLGYRRQTPDVRRTLFNAQMILDPGDPINYARRIFLDPVRDATVGNQPRSVLVANSVGDTNVCVNVGPAYARAAGVLPFLPPDAPDHLAEWRTPAGFAARYDGAPTPNDVLLRNHAIEGVARLGRHPTADTENFLVDVDDVSDGIMRFSADGRHQQADGLAPPRLARPLRWVRSSRPRTGPSDDPYAPVFPEPLSGVLLYYVVPEGVHGFDEIIYPADVPFDVSQYFVNLMAHYAATGGTDLLYRSDPDGHHCLEDSSCPFFDEYRGGP